MLNARLRHLLSQTRCDWIKACGVSTLIGAALLLPACQQQELFPGMEAPTQMQSDAMGWPAPQMINVEQGDNQDPSFDNPNYPYSSQPWYTQPGYLQG